MELHKKGWLYRKSDTPDKKIVAFCEDEKFPFLCEIKLIDKKELSTNVIQSNGLPCVYMYETDSDDQITDVVLFAHVVRIYSNEYLKDQDYAYIITMLEEWLLMAKDIMK